MVSTWKASPFVAFTVARRRPRSSEWTRHVVDDAVAARAGSRLQDLLVLHLLREKRRAAPGEDGGFGRAGAASSRSWRKTCAGVAVSGDEELVGVLDALGEGRHPHREAGRGELLLQMRPWPSCPASSLSRARIDALDALALEQVQVVRGEAVGAVDRDRGGDPRPGGRTRRRGSTR